MPRGASVARRTFRTQARNTQPAERVRRSKPISGDFKMDLWVYEWPSGLKSVVLARNQEEALDRLDPSDRASKKRLRLWPRGIPFLVDFRSDRDGSGESLRHEWVPMVDQKLLRKRLGDPKKNLDVRIRMSVKNEQNSRYHRRPPGRHCGLCREPGHDRRTCVARNIRELRERTFR